MSWNYNPSPQASPVILPSWVSNVSEITHISLSESFGIFDSYRHFEKTNKVAASTIPGSFTIFSDDPAISHRVLNLEEHLLSEY